MRNAGGPMARAGSAILALLCLATAACASPTTRPTDAPAAIDVRTLETQTDAGPVRGFLAVVDLERAEVTVAASSPRVTTLDWAVDAGVDLAVNANYFSATAPIGLVVSDGVVVSPARGVDPVLLVSGNRARVVVGEALELNGVDSAVAGVGATERTNRGAALLRGGINTAVDARVAAEQRHPRTAIGVDDTGRYLYLVAIDGRQPNWSVGITLPDLANLLLAHGATDAINLDGGGSTAFILRGVTNRMNRPSDGAFRPVAVHLGVRVKGQADE